MLLRVSSFKTKKQDEFWNVKIVACLVSAILSNPAVDGNPNSVKDVIVHVEFVKDASAKIDVYPTMISLYPRLANVISMEWASANA